MDGLFFGWSGRTIDINSKLYFKNCSYCSHLKCNVICGCFADNMNTPLASSDNKLIKHSSHSSYKDLGHDR
jgi:hypothetical protein